MTEPQTSDDQIDEVLDLVAEFMEQTLDVLDVHPDTSVDIRVDGDRVYGYLEGEEDDIALIIGRRGQTLDAIQYLANAVVSSRSDSSLHVELDAQDYRKRRARQLEKEADRAVATVMRSGDQVLLDPMTSSERKVIHQYLKDHPDVATVSTGRDPNRRLAVEPRNH